MKIRHRQANQHSAEVMEDFCSHPSCCCSFHRILHGCCCLHRHRTPILVFSFVANKEIEKASERQTDNAPSTDLHVRRRENVRRSIALTGHFDSCNVRHIQPVEIINLKTELKWAEAGGGNHAATRNSEIRLGFDYLFIYFFLVFFFVEVHRTLSPFVSLQRHTATSSFAITDNSTCYRLTDRPGSLLFSRITTELNGPGQKTTRE